MIVFCHLLNDSSGSPRVLRSTLQACDGYTDRLLYIGSQGRGVLEEACVPTRRYWYHRSKFRIITLFNYLASQVFLYRSLSRAKDIPTDATVFVNTLLPFGAMLWGWRSGREVIVHIHEVSISPKLLRYCLIGCASYFADKLLYVSQDHLARLPIFGPPAEIIFNPVDPILKARAEKVLYSPRKSGAFEVIMLASLRGYKGIEEIIALARALRKRDDIHFTLVLNADPDVIEAFNDLNPPNDNLTVHSRTNNPSTFYVRADLLLNLSRTDQCIETFGLTIVEAMTFGVPVIVPPVGGPAEIVSHGVQGYCIDSRDSSAVEAAVLELADNKDRAISMSENARIHARKFSFDIYARKLRSYLLSYK